MCERERETEKRGREGDRENERERTKEYSDSFDSQGLLPLRLGCHTG